jgi:NADH-quinone oxidoreductase subunit G
VQDRAGLHFLLSAHASNEEFFLFRRLADNLAPPQPVVTVSWRYQPKSQPQSATFKVPPVDAPNVNGARSFGFVGGNLADPVAEADVSALRAAVDAGQVSALYVFDPGPDGSIGDIEWILTARARGRLPLLIVQGVLLTELARAADFVLPGASWVEKQASYMNDQGRLQGATRAIALPGEAIEDWNILVKLGVALGVPLDYSSAEQIRADIATRYADRKGFEGLTTLEFGRPVAAQNWLQASNPSERWKWDFMFQDLPPVKGSVDPSAVPMPAGAIPLREVK